jgi:hypothetical protein
MSRSEVRMHAYSDEEDFDRYFNPGTCVFCGGEDPQFRGLLRCQRGGRLVHQFCDRRCYLLDRQKRGMVVDLKELGTPSLGTGSASDPG